MATCSPTALLAAGKCFCGVTVRDRITARLALLCQRLQTLNPMATCNPNSLIAASKGCWCKVTTKDAEVVELQLLAQTLQALSPGAAIDIPSLMAQGAACFCGVTTSPFEMVRLQLLCDIQAAGGGGGGPCPQDMQVSWTPTNVKLGELIGLNAFDSRPALPGITGLVYDQVTMNESIDIEHSIDLVTCSGPNLTAFTNKGYIAFLSDSVLTTLSFPLLTNLDPSNSGNFQVSGCVVLTTVDFSSVVPQNGLSVNFSNNALLAASVNQILARCVANAAYVSGTVDVSGGTNAAPTGQGIADKATLIGRGCTVLTN